MTTSYGRQCTKCCSETGRITSLCSASSVNVTLPAFAAERRAAAPLLSIDISRPHGAQQQTRRTPPLRSNDRTYIGRTDGRTPDRCIDPAPHSCGYYYDAGFLQDAITG